MTPRLVLLRLASLPIGALDALRAGESRTALRSLLDLERELAADAASLSGSLFAAAGVPDGDRERTRERFALLALRRDLHNARKPRTEHLDTARAALSPETVEGIRRHVEGLDRLAGARSAYRAAFEADLARGRREILRAASCPLVSHGLFLASRSLLPKLGRLSRTDPTRWTHDQRHSAAKLAAYVSRFSSKTSPNGVFCSVALAEVSGRTVAVEGAPEIARLDVLLSISEARKVTACLAVDPAVERAIVPRPNPTLREDAGSWTWWKPATARRPTDDEVLSRARDLPLLRLFLEEAGRGVHDVPALVAAVAARSGHGNEDLRAFLGTLVERGILVAEIEIPFSCRRPLREIAAAARRAGCDAPWVAILERIESEVDRLPGVSHEERSSAMERVAGAVESLPRVREIRADELFRVDAASALRVRLPERVLDDLRNPLRVFVRLLAAMYPESLHHRDLVSRYLREYPPDAEVPALDLYRGFAGPEDGSSRPLEFPEPAAGDDGDRSVAKARAVARRARDWFAARAREAAPGEEVEFGEEELRSLAGDVPEPRWACGVLFQIAAGSGRDVEAGRYRLAINSLFNGWGLAVARFADLLGGGSAAEENPVVRELRAGWSSLARPGAVLAELTYNHAGRTANAGLRPVLFRHEIELPGDRSSPGVASVPLGDLLVRYDSAEGRLVVRSRSLGVDVVPILSSGVNPAGLVSDLVHIGRQGWQTVGYLPGFRADGVVRWPRFTCGRAVLFRERWVLAGARRPPTSHRGAPLSDADFFAEVARWREALALPRRVFVHTEAEPKPFYVDLESPVLVDLLRRAVSGASARDGGRLFVTEALPGPEEGWVRGDHGAHATEFLVQMQGPAPGAAAQQPSS